jgi:hypothetical protein
MSGGNLQVLHTQPIPPGCNPENSMSLKRGGAESYQSVHPQ